ncbi:MAG: hypothetical protein SFZ24_02810 [Planctomycetota bacterium]|nr:hypothetical protein [Planctomycetota bacterium]
MLDVLAVWVCVVVAQVGPAAEGAPGAQAQRDGAEGFDLGRLQATPEFWVRPGYVVTRVASDIEAARFMEFDDRGTLYVSSPGGTIVTLRDENADGWYETRGAFVRNMQSVHGLHFHNGWMWFTTSGLVWKARDRDGDGAHDDLQQVTDTGDMPQGGNHWWRSILVTDRHYYTGIGDSGNISDESGTDRQKIFRFNLDGSGKTLFASGVRNTEKLRFRPGTEEIWGVDHGSDNFGVAYDERPGRRQPITDYNPPDEFNRYVEGGFYGHPFLTGLRVPRPEFAERPDIVDLAARTIVPEWCFPAHAAANAFCFIEPELNARTGAFPADHGGDAIVACRGSWNRTEKAGYEVVRVLFDRETGKPFGALTLVRTLSARGDILARPVDCVQAPDGSVFFSCDHTKAVYRLRSAAPASGAPAEPAAGGS